MNHRWEQFKKIGDPRIRLNWVTRQIDYVREFELEAMDIPELVEIVELWGDEEFLSGQDEDAVDEDGDEDDFIIWAPERVDEIIVGTWSEIRKGLGASGLGLAPEKDKPTIGFLLGRDSPMPDFAKLELNNAKEPKPGRKRKGKRKKLKFK